MSIYAIGDVHGQREALLRLLEQLNYDEAADELWFVGDIINRGPDSAGALRLVTSLKGKVKVVMGNHDFTLLVQAADLDKGRIKKTTKEILSAPDAQEMIAKMQTWGLMEEDAERGIVMTHAGVYPYWDLATAREMDAQYRQQMQQTSDKRREFLREVYRNGSGKWKEKAKMEVKQCFAVNAFARMRFLNTDGSLDYDAKIPPEEAAKNLMPWYDIHAQRQNYRIVFGHWAALGLRVHEKYACIDGGAAWGGELIAFDLADWQVAAKVATAK